MEEQERQAFALRLKRLRVYKRWTNDELAHVAGVSPRTVSRLETAKVKDPRENTIKRLAAAFEMTRDEFAGPRVSPETMDKALETQLDRMEAMLKEVLSRLPLGDQPPGPTAVPSFPKPPDLPPLALGDEPPNPRVQPKRQTRKGTGSKPSTG